MQSITQKVDGISLDNLKNLDIQLLVSMVCEKMSSDKKHESIESLIRGVNALHDRVNIGITRINIDLVKTSAVNIIDNDTSLAAQVYNINDTKKVYGNLFHVDIFLIKTYINQLNSLAGQFSGLQIILLLEENREYTRVKAPEILIIDGNKYIGCGLENIKFTLQNTFTAYGLNEDLKSNLFTFTKEDWKQYKEQLICQEKQTTC